MRGMMPRNDIRNDPIHGTVAGRHDVDAGAAS
jgi:hypothetical protein